MGIVLSAAPHGLEKGGGGTQQKREQKDRRHEHHPKKTCREHQFVGDLAFFAARKFVKWCVSWPMNAPNRGSVPVCHGKTE